MTSDRLQALRAQLQSLRAQHDAGQLDTAAYDAQRAQLERELLDLVVAEGVGPGTGTQTATVALSPATEPAADAVRAPRALWGAIGAVVVAVAAIGYTFTGAPQLASLGPEASRAAAEAARAAEAAASAPMTMDQLKTLTARLAERMKTQPDDPVGWAMLGRAYMLLQQPADAVAAYQQALQRKPDDAQILVDLADAIAIRQDRNLSGEPAQLIERALKIDPNNLKALSLAGSVAFDRKDYATAVRHWQQLIAIGQLDPQLAQQVQGSIDEARKLGGLPAEPAAAAAAATAPAGDGGSAPIAAAAAGVTGTVTLAPALQAQAGPDDTVFVYARAAEGPRMPLAILRHKVRELPLRFTLDDSLAMSPQMKLSGYPQVVVEARISKTGDAMPQPGDLGGKTGPVPVGSRDLQIEIRDVIGR